MVVPGVTHCEKCWARIDINRGKTCMCDTEKKIFVDERKENKMEIQEYTMTNGEYIRNMTDEELAFFLTNDIPYNLFFTQNNQPAVEQWLREKCKLLKQNKKSKTFAFKFGDVVNTRDGNGRGVVIFRCTKMYLTTGEEENIYLVCLQKTRGQKQYTEADLFLAEEEEDDE